jgi:dipeptidase D
LASVDGGSLRNAIPREAHAVITIPADGFDEFMELAVETEEMFNQEFEGIEKNINLQVVKTVMPQGILPEEVQDDFINAVYAAPNGVFRHIPHMYGVVETSNNLASIVTDEKTVKVKCLIRSSEESKKYELCSMLESLFSLAGAKVEFLGGYPGWKPNLDSEILLEMKRIYKRKWDKNPVVKVIHAGLECGILASVEPDLDMISFGPTIRYPHSPNEKVCISSVQKFWDLLIETIKYLPSVEE